MSAFLGRRRVLKAVCENCRNRQFFASLGCKISLDSRHHSILLSNRYPIGFIYFTQSFSFQYLSVLPQTLTSCASFRGFSKDSSQYLTPNETYDNLKASDKKLLSALSRKRRKKLVKLPAIIPYNYIRSIFQKSVFAMTSRHFEVIEALERENEILFTTEVFQDMIKEEFVQLSNALFTCDFDSLKNIATPELITEAQNKIQGFRDDEKDMFLYELRDVLYIGAENITIYDKEGSSMNKTFENMAIMDRWRLLTKPHFVEPLEDIRKAVLVAKLWCHTAVSGVEEPSIDREWASPDGSVITVRVVLEQNYLPEMRYLIGVSVERNVRKFLRDKHRFPSWTLSAFEYGYGGQLIACDPNGSLATEKEGGDDPKRIS